MNLKILPKQIECFDISNISKQYIVGGMCTIQNGKLKKNLTKKFKIKTILKVDDPKCIQEVIKRRIKHSTQKDNKSFGNIPNLIFVDGGITQIKAAKKAIDEYNLDIPIFGMLKNEKHKTKSLINIERKEINIDSELLNFITYIQEEVHNVAINYSRNLINKSITKSKLDDIEGIGEKRKQDLLKKFGSIDEIKKADEYEIAKIKGISIKKAKEIKEKIKEKT